MNDPTKVIFSDCANGPKGAPLDTLAQLGKKARAKYALQPLLLALVDVSKVDPEGDEIRSSYWSSYHCAGVLEQKGQKLQGRYCNQRWCLVCSRIRTAKLINKYGKHFNRMEQPYFVTLTAPTIAGTDLSGRIKAMAKDWKNIQDVMKKRGTPLVGVRKIECTYNPETDKYHPHFHALIEGGYEAEVLREEWLKRNPTASDKAQDVREADENTLLEVFKYTAKHCSKGKRTMNPEALHTIYKALRGVRTFQSLGGFGTAEIADEEEEIKLYSQSYDFLKDEQKQWIWEGCDWKSRGEALTGYEPSEAIEKFRTSIEPCNVNTAKGNLPLKTSNTDIAQTTADNGHFIPVNTGVKRAFIRPYTKPPKKNLQPQTQ